MTTVQTDTADEIELVVRWLRTQAKLLPSGARICIYLADEIERGAHLNQHGAELAGDVLATVPAADPDRVLLAGVVNKTCDLFAVHPRDLLGDYRYRFLIPARFALYAALEGAGWSRRRTGRALGKDHSTLRNGAERAADMARRDPKYAKKLAAITAVVKEQMT